MKRWYLLACLFFLVLQGAQAQNKPFKPKGTPLTPFMKGLMCKVGEVMYVQFEEHPSTGLVGEVAISDEAIVSVKERHQENANPNKEGMTGADQATITVVFKAEKVGKSTITVREVFRGETRQSYSIEVEVKPKRR